MCLVIATWDTHSGMVASEGRMMQQSPYPVAVGPVTKTIAAEDCFKVHRITPSVVVGIIGWTHVTDELLVSLRTDLTTYDEAAVTRHMVRVMDKHPGVPLQAVVMGIQGGRVHAAMWGDFDPAHPHSPTHPTNKAKVIALGDDVIASEAIKLARRGVPLQKVFETLSQKHDTINDRVHIEEIYA